jgi:acyl-CoA dehydrogenase
MSVPGCVFSSDLRAVVDDVLGGRAADDSDELWSLVHELGWPGVGTPEDQGGAGGDLADAAELAAGIGRHAAPIPLMETALAGWALAGAGAGAWTEIGDARAAVVRAEAVSAEADGAGVRLCGAAPRVRWPEGLERAVLVLRDDTFTRLAVADAAALLAEPLPSLADDPVVTLRLDGVRLPAGSVVTAPAGLAEQVRVRGDVLAAAALVGAMERACALAGEHVMSRHQFGQPLAKLQAVRHLIADAAVERDIAAAAVAVAIERPGAATAHAARATAGRAAGAVATAAHQVHGAMGITREHVLHTVTRRLWSWRDEGGTQREHEQRLGELVLAADGSDVELWAVVTGTP